MIEKLYKELKKELPSISILCNSNSGSVNIKGIDIFITHGPSSESTLESYLMGLQQGLLINK